MNKRYIPDTSYYLINGFWNFIIFTFAIGGTLALFYFQKFDLKFFASLFYVIGSWFIIFIMTVSIKKWDKKYRDKLLTNHKSAQFMIPLAFSRETLIKLSIFRFTVYFKSYSRNSYFKELKREILPMFERKKEIKLYDIVFVWGFILSFALGTVLFYCYKFYT